MSSEELNDKIAQLFEVDDWAAARRLLEQARQNDPTNHWVLTQLGVTLYEQRRYAEALRWFRKSLRIVDDCPLTLWNLAGALDALGKHTPALRVYTRLLKSDVSYDDDPCWESQEWTDSMKANCVYRLAACFEQLGKKIKAEQCYRQYMNLLLTGVNGMYPAQDVIERIRRISRRQRSQWRGRAAAQSRARYVADRRSDLGPSRDCRAIARCAAACWTNRARRRCRGMRRRRRGIICGWRISRFAVGESVKCAHHALSIQPYRKSTVMMMPVPCERPGLARSVVTPPPGPIGMMLFGSILGWVVGMLWWATLMFFVYGPTLRGVDNTGRWQKKQIDRQLGYVPASGIPWAIAGAIAGIVGGMVRGYGPPVGALIGMGSGGFLALISERWDAYGAVIIAYHSFLWTILGLVCGAVYQCDFAPTRRQDATRQKEE